MKKKKVDNSLLINRFDIKNNSITLVSIICSIMIILFHSYPLFYGMNVLGPISKILAPFNIGKLVVSTFFIISGFMISKSIKRSSSISNYVGKRIKKIFPGLIIVVLITALIIAPVVSILPKGEFLLKPELYLNYIFDNILLYRNTGYFITTVFADNIYPNAINGSLWSIKHTFISYLIFIPIYLYLIKDKKSFKQYLIMFGLLFVFNTLSIYGLLNPYHEFISTYFGDIGVLKENNLFIENMYFFLAGVLFDVFSDKIKIDIKYFGVGILIYALLLKTPLNVIAYELILPYTIIFLITLKTKFKAKDISYYIYLFGFVVQQTIYHYMKGYNLYLFMILSVVISVVLSILLNIFINEVGKIIKSVRSKGVNA
jgi:peptidoglycan/LPS O-acetylase OafA/YrhL